MRLQRRFRESQWRLKEFKSDFRGFRRISKGFRSLTGLQRVSGEAIDLGALILFVLKRPLKSLQFKGRALYYLKQIWNPLDPIPLISRHPKMPKALNYLENPWSLPKLAPWNTKNPRFQAALNLLVSSLTSLQIPRIKIPFSRPKLPNSKLLLNWCTLKPPLR